jgi:hypothetical protein
MNQRWFPKICRGLRFINFLNGHLYQGSHCVILVILEDVIKIPTFTCNKQNKNKNMHFEHLYQKVKNNFFL